MTTMKLSEAMELGYPEIHHTNLSWLYESNGGCVGCALGAALFAVGERETRLEINKIMAEHWPWTKGFKVDLPVYGVVELPEAITYKYAQVRSGKIVFDELLAWVRSIEPAEEPAVQPVEQAKAEGQPVIVTVTRQR